MAVTIVKRVYTTSLQTRSTSVEACVWLLVIAEATAWHSSVSISIRLQPQQTRHDISLFILKYEQRKILDRFWFISLPQPPLQWQAGSRNRSLKYRESTVLSTVLHPAVKRLHIKTHTLLSILNQLNWYGRMIIADRNRRTGIFSVDVFGFKAQSLPCERMSLSSKKCCLISFCLSR